MRRRVVKRRSKTPSETGIGTPSSNHPALGDAQSGCHEKGVIISYPDRAYADQRALTLLSQLRRYLSSSEYSETLPVQIMECCNQIRRLAITEKTAALEMSGAFDVREHPIYFRVLLLPHKRSSDAAPVLILLSGIAPS